MEKTKVLYYNSTLKKGGTDIYMLGVVKNLDKEKFAVDVLVKDGDTIDNSMLSDLENDGHKVFLAHGSFMKRMLFLRKFFKQHKNQYDVCHINATSQAMGLVAYMAKHYAKIKKVVFHSHVGGVVEKDIADIFGAGLMKKYSTTFATCSSSASKFMYGEKFCKSHKIQLLNNSVDTDLFTFNTEIRRKTRQDLKIDDDTFVILLVARFEKEKNHTKLIEVFDNLHKIEPNSKLVLIGNGSLLEEIKKYANSLNLSNNILFLGEQNKIANFMQASDCFVMTSFFEGLPIVAVEAQSTGLPLVLSNKISSQTKLTDDVKFVGLDEPLENWSKMILSFKTHKRHSNKQILVEKGFDKNTAIKEIEKLYLE